MSLPDPLPIAPAPGPIRGSIRPPGSKSLTNRALTVAALAEGPSQLIGVLDSRDTQVMIEGLRRLGIEVQHDTSRRMAELTGCAGCPPASDADLWLENSGTAIRFLTAACTLGHGRFRLDGNDRMRERPIRDLVTTLNELGAQVQCLAGTECPPVSVTADGLPGGTANVTSHRSSQYLSALLMAAPCAQSPVALRIDGDLVSAPYVEMTLGVMARFGVTVDTSEPNCYRVQPSAYRGCDFIIEPDASAASYFFAAAAITGGEVTVEGLSRYALQGDVAFVDLLEQMGCRVAFHKDSITVCGGRLRGIEVDMNAVSDTAQTLAVVAPFADGPTRIRNIAHVRHKETDRVAALVTELRRLGLSVEEHSDGITIQPGTVRPATIQTYQDHRMAMSFALVGLKVPGIQIADPGCTAKTYPRFFDDLQRLCTSKP